MPTELRDILERACQVSGSPSAAGVVVSHDAVLALDVVGVRRLGGDTPATIDDTYHTGSNAKAMTAAMIASLVHKGMLRWDSRPLEVFPDLAGKTLSGYESVTLESLLRHTAGVPPYMDDEAEDFVVPDFGGIADEQQISYFSKWLLQNRAPIAEPGTAFHYSNAGYSIAAAMAEAVAESTWSELLKSELFGPLGVDAVTGRGWPGRQGRDQPWGHLIEKGKVVPHDPEGEYQLEPFLAPAGDVSLAMADYGRFLQMNLRGLQGEDDILPSRVVRFLHNDGEPGYGMGWGVTTVRPFEALGLFSTHAGSGGTFIMAAGVSHEQDRAVAFATNSGSGETIQAGFKQMIAHFLERRSATSSAPE